MQQRPIVRSIQVAETRNFFRCLAQRPPVFRAARAHQLLLPEPRVAQAPNNSISAVGAVRERFPRFFEDRIPVVGVGYFSRIEKILAVVKI